MPTLLYNCCSTTRSRSNFLKNPSRRYSNSVRRADGYFRRHILIQNLNRQLSPSANNTTATAITYQNYTIFILVSLIVSNPRNQATHCFSRYITAGYPRIFSIDKMGNGSSTEQPVGQDGQEDTVFSLSNDLQGM